MVSFTFTPRMPPSLFHLSTIHSAVFFPEAPKRTAGPERKSTNPIFSSAGAPAGRPCEATWPGAVRRSARAPATSAQHENVPGRENRRISGLLSAKFGSSGRRDLASEWNVPLGNRSAVDFLYSRGPAIATELFDPRRRNARPVGASRRHRVSPGPDERRGGLGGPPGAPQPWSGAGRKAARTGWRSGPATGGGEGRAQAARRR